MMKKLLHINGCLRGQDSRTLRLARAFLARRGDVSVEELVLADEEILPLNAERLAKRERLLASRSFEDPFFRYARQFAGADEIVLSAPYWDLSFPSKVRLYWEQVSICGVTFSYSEEGIPVGHCRAERLTYITTAGGYLGSANHGFAYVSDLCRLYFGIRECRCIAAEGLDIVGHDPEAILREAVGRL